MTTDPITDRLRRARNTTLPVGALWNLCEAAADEIERLRDELAKIREADNLHARNMSLVFNSGDGTYRP